MVKYRSISRTLFRCLTQSCQSDCKMMQWKSRCFCNTDVLNFFLLQYILQRPKEILSLNLSTLTWKGEYPLDYAAALGLFFSLHRYLYTLMSWFWFLLASTLNTEWGAGILQTHFCLLCEERFYFRVHFWTVLETYFITSVNLFIILCGSYFIKA